VAYAWFAYAQEPLPEPDWLPGNYKPMTDRARQRRPRNLTTLLFRAYPAQAKRMIAERLEAEGWFDDEQWDISDWFADRLGGKPVKVGGEVKWAEEAWRKALRAWERHGQEDKLRFSTPAAEETMRESARVYWRKMRVGDDTPVPPNIEGQLSPEDLPNYRAARYMGEYNFYRGLSRFAGHYNKCVVEKAPATVAARKLIYKAERLDMAGNKPQALALYTRVITPLDCEKAPTPGARTPAGEKPLGDPGLKPLVNYTPLTAWRDLVLATNKEYRRDITEQEHAAEIQIRYLYLHNRYHGRELKDKIGRVSVVLPLVPKLYGEPPTPPIVAGPFDNILDEDNVPYLPDYAVESVMERLRLPARRRRGPPELPTGPPPGKGVSRPPPKIE
jgi:hypothetical protein